MKIALCMSGHMRTWEKCYDNLKKNILSKYEVDIFISTWNVIDYQGNIDDENIVNLDDISKIYGSSLKECEIENYQEVLPFLSEHASNITANIGVGCQPIRCISMFYKNYKSINMIRNLDYDIVIKTRPDLVYFGDIVLEDINSINIPIEQPINNGKIYNDDIDYYIGSIIDTFGGYPDSMIYSNKENMLNFSNLYNEYYNYWLSGHTLHPELLLKFHLDKVKSDVKRTKFGVEILRKNKKKDGSFIHDINNDRVFY